MQTYIKTVTLTLTLFLLIACRIQTSLDKNVEAGAISIQNLRYPTKVIPLVSAHRGGKYIDNFPENCLETFQLLSNYASLIIECDIRQTADSVLYLLHDDNLQRTTTGIGTVKSITWE